MHTNSLETSPCSCLALSCHSIPSTPKTPPRTAPISTPTAPAAAVLAGPAEPVADGDVPVGLALPPVTERVDTVLLPLATVALLDAGSELALVGPAVEAQEAAVWVIVTPELEGVQCYYIYQGR